MLLDLSNTNLRSWRAIGHMSWVLDEVTLININFLYIWIHFEIIVFIVYYLFLFIILINEYSINIDNYDCIGFLSMSHILLLYCYVLSSNCNLYL